MSAQAALMPLPEAIDLAGRYRALSRLGGCAQPIRVRGDVRHMLADGRVRLAYSTRREPGSVMLVPCGNRRASRCPSCAETYRADTFHLIRAGLLGEDKGVPGSVRQHPRVLATFTAPSFGPVHAHRPSAGRDRKSSPCHPRRSAPTCPHGRRLSCTDRHELGDELVGQPLCADCYDYAGHVLWNAEAGRLWQRFTLRLRRELAHLAGLTEAAFNRQARVSFAKVAEFQARGMVHFHAVIRLDGRDSDGALVDPPSWATVQLLTSGIRAAAAGAFVTSPEEEAAGGSHRIAFGRQIDVAPIVAEELTGTEMTEEKVAGYIAKYATKGATTEGTVDRRIKERADINGLALTDHQRRLIDTCWQLGDSDAHPKLTGLRLRSWAHMLGYRGHFSTKSRRYSTTLGALREVRCSFRRQQAQEHGGDRWQPVDSSTLVITTWQFAGQGYVDATDQYIADLVRQEREERRRSRARRLLHIAAA
ncbi:replication initiator [Nonomuraea sp. NPDC048882]|uniref:replication initiator n=1 Tax=Nonomuraea sp. NPDC048882 TaxID=3154347 RepID=UPI0033E38B55